MRHRLHARGGRVRRRRQPLAQGLDRRFHVCLPSADTPAGRYAGTGDSDQRSRHLVEHDLDHARVEPVDRQRGRRRLRALPRHRPRRKRLTDDLLVHGPDLREAVHARGGRLRRRRQPLHQGDADRLHERLSRHPGTHSADRPRRQRRDPERDHPASASPATASTTAPPASATPPPGPTPSAASPAAPATRWAPTPTTPPATAPPRRRSPPRPPAASLPTPLRRRSRRGRSRSARPRRRRSR